MQEEDRLKMLHAQRTKITVTPFIHDLDKKD
jgi:hypothetical protein